MHKSKKVCNAQESIGMYCSYLHIPSCEREILLLLTVILFILNNNSKKIYGRCYNKSNKKKDDIIKNNFDLSKIYDNLSCDNNIKRYEECQNESSKIKDDIIKPNIPSDKIYETSFGENSTKRYDKCRNKSIKKNDDIIKSDSVPNETYNNLKEEVTVSYNESKSTPEFQSNINQFEKVTESNNLEQCGNINDENHDKEIVNIPLPVTINEYPEEISIQDFPVENMIQSENNSYSLNICTEEECNKTLISLGEMLKNYYKGVMVCAMLPNGIIISGEVAFNFNHIVALKYNNTIIFINEDQIISFY